MIIFKTAGNKSFAGSQIFFFRINDNLFSLGIPTNHINQQTNDLPAIPLPKVCLFANQIIYAVGFVGTVNRIPVLPRFIAVIILTESDGLTSCHYDKMMDETANTISLPDLIKPYFWVFIPIQNIGFMQPFIQQRDF